MYINSNLTPTQAVELYPELQVCEKVAEWAQAAEDIDAIKNNVNDAAHELGSMIFPEDYLFSLFEVIDNLRTSKMNKSILKARISELQNEINQNSEYAAEKIEQLKGI